MHLITGQAKDNHKAKQQQQLNLQVVARLKI